MEIVIHMPSKDETGKIIKDIDLIRFKKVCKILETLELNEGEYKLLLEQLEKEKSSLQ
jgi:hypothetical protein